MKKIKIGTPITLELQQQEQEEPEKYKCKIVDYQDGYIYTDYPVKESSGRTGFFLEGTQFQGNLVGNDGSVYWFDSEVVGRKKLTIPVIVLTFPNLEELVRIQRRKYVRVKTSIDVAVEVSSGERPSFTSVTQDISGGGVAIFKPKSHKLEKGQIVQLTLVLPMNSGEYRYVETQGVVIRVIPKEESGQEQASIEFDSILEKDRQTIIQHCFEQQMYIRKRGIK